MRDILNLLIDLKEYDLIYLDFIRFFCTNSDNFSLLETAISKLIEIL